ncbi:MAG: cation transporter, partial [Eubacteriales bacterium]|nr:cation transporter [Eubacteriales bacterium]
METKQFDIQGMHCASCAASVEKRAGALPGVQEASVNLATEKLQIRYDPGEFTLDALKREIDGLGYVFVAPQVESSVTIPIEGMHCASCAQAVERELK